MPAIVVEWGLEQLEVDVDLTKAPHVLKSQLFAKTSVPHYRQRIMIKGKTLGDHEWMGIKLVNGSTITMIGSSNLLLHPIPRGLNNLGKTCYMNSVLQSLKTIPELRHALEEIRRKNLLMNLQVCDEYSNNMMCVADQMSRLFEVLHRYNRSAHSPNGMLQILHKVCPHFAVIGRGKTLMQQDANECFMHLLRQCLGGLDAATMPSTHFFIGKFVVSQKCLECDSEPSQSLYEDFFQLTCFLSRTVKRIEMGIKESLTEEIVKNSTALGRDAKWQKKALIERLPAYISVQMARFFYKDASQTYGKTNVDVKFPMILDLYDICTPAHQDKMQPYRDAVKLEEDAKIERLRQKKMEGIDADVDDEKDGGVALPFSFENDPGSNNSAFYQLQAVISHMGISPNSGHYVAWVRLEGDNWAMCDDDEVHPVAPEEVVRLSGGHHDHSAYILLYGPRIVKKYPEMKSDAIVTEEPMQTN